MKKSKMHRILAMLLCLVLTVSLLAGCNEAPAEDTKSAETKAPTTEPIAAETTEPVEEPYLPLVKEGDEPVTLTIGVMQNVNTVDYETNDYTLWLEEQTGIKLDFVYFDASGDGARTQLALMMNGGEELPDILWEFTALQGNLGWEYGRDGYFVDMLPLIEEYGYYYDMALENFVAPEDLALVTSAGIDPVSGAQYALSHYEASTGSSAIANHLMINAKWLEAVGEEIPTTVADLERVLEKFVTMDPNGNGQADEMGIVGKIDRVRGDLLEYISNAYIFNNKEYQFNQDENGNLYLPYTTDEYRQALITLNRMYGKGLIAPVSFTLANDGETMAIFTPASGTPVAGVVAGHPSLIVADQSEIIFDYVGLPPLKDETGKGGYQPRRAAVNQYNTYITEDCENVELAFKLLDFMFSEESVIRQRFGVKDVHWKYAEEGAVTNLGFPARIDVLDDTVFSQQGNATWHYLGCVMVNYNKIGNSYTLNGEPTWAQRRSNWINTVLLENWDAATNPKPVFSVVYNEAENEIVKATSKLVYDYIVEARALFVTGVMDPNSDKDWNEYLNNLKAQGADQYSEAANSAWDRMGN